MPDIAPIDIPQPLLVAVADAVARAKSMIVASDEEANAATDACKLLGTLVKQIENHRKDIVGPINDQVKRINAMYKQQTSPLEEADVIVRSKLQAYISEKNRKAAENERKRREEAALAVAARAEVEGKTDKAEMALKIALAADSPDVRTTSVGQTGATGLIRKTWTYEIVDEETVPRQYLVVSDAAIKLAISAGVRVIPGVRIYEKEGLTIR